MDKTEYQEKLEELQDLIREKNYKAAYDLVNGIDWRKVKSTRTLNMVADIYEVNKDYEKCRQILSISLSRASIGKSILYRLTEVCIKQKDIKSAEEYYQRYCKLAPRDNNRILLEYRLGRANNRPVEEQIQLLEEYKEREYTERWAYELALLYSKADNIEKCVETCDDMILWFSEGKYVLKAMELKRKYKELTPSQRLYYEKEQRGADARLIFGKSETEEKIRAPKKGSVLERMDAAGAEVTKNVNVANTGVLPVTSEELKKFSVTSRQFIGGKPDLKQQLKQSIKDVYAGVKDAPRVDIKPVDAPTEEFDLNAFLKETQTGFSNAANAGAEEAPDLEREPEEKKETPIEEMPIQQENPISIEDIVIADPVFEEKTEKVQEEIPEQPVKAEQEPVEAESVQLQEKEQVAEEPVQIQEEKTEEQPAEEAFGLNVQEKKPAPVWDDREIPDPEPTEEEKRTRTIPLGKVGQNTVPISIEDVLKAETPEERRIRILNNAIPTKMSDQQRQIFTYFARIPGMDSQILTAMSGVYEHAGEHTSKKGNVVVMGAAGTGKSRVSNGLITAMCQDMQLEVAKTARITGEKMNTLDPARVVSKMAGGFLVIENASDMTSVTVEKLNQAMEFRTDCMILIIEDNKTPMRAFLKKYPEFADKFSGTISIPVFTNDELVTFARTYCAENNCQMDELGVLALYSLISSGQSEEEPMTISEVKEIIDSAIAKAKRGGRRGRRSASKDKTVTLYEKDFA